MPVSPEEIRQILAALEGSAWDEALITVGDTQIAVSRNGATLPVPGGTTPAPVAAPAPRTPDAPAPAPVSAPAPESAAPSPSSEPVVGGVEVTSPTVGIFWRAPEPGAAPFVEVGSTVAAGDIVCIVEVMKLMSNVTAPVSGRIAAIHVDNSKSVEFDQVLMTIVPEEG